jgi:hypothetical protein
LIKSHSCPTINSIIIAEILVERKGEIDMKKMLLIIIVLAITVHNSGAARSAKNFGLGIIVGEPTGLSGKLWLSGKSAIDGAVAWSLSDDEAFHIHGDYLLHNFGLIEVEKGSMPFYFGIGGRIKFRDEPHDDIVSARIPVGLNYMFESTSLDIFVEVVPMLDLVPDTDFDIAGGIGIRYFF